MKALTEEYKRRALERIHAMVCGRNPESEDDRRERMERAEAVRARAAERRAECEKCPELVGIDAAGLRAECWARARETAGCGWVSLMSSAAKCPAGKWTCDPAKGATETDEN